MNTDPTPSASGKPAPKNDRIIRIPIGARLKMRGGMFTVTSGSKQSLIITGPVKSLKIGERLKIFGHIAEITRREVKNARLQLLTKGEFDTRPILQIEEEPAPQAEQPAPEPRCEGCGGSIISKLCSCGTPHPDFQREPEPTAPTH